MDSLEPARRALVPGQLVRAKIVSHQPWGLFVDIVGREGVGASVDLIEQFSAAFPGRQIYQLFLPVGTEIDAVVEQVRDWYPSERGIRQGGIRLSIRPADLTSFSWSCDFCGQPTTLSPGGDGLSLAVLTTDGPEGYTVTSHRECLAERIRPEDGGQRARALWIGKPLPSNSPPE
ncbi:hypothetical protein [Nocardia sp. NPDC057440]|uniref:hypothetical protein n=1 Tax=Nocardia sp. NPDC057440 TaxID=3346134 RepID=UPI003672024F